MTNIFIIYSYFFLNFNSNFINIILMFNLLSNFFIFNYLKGIKTCLYKVYCQKINFSHISFKNLHYFNYN